MKYVRSITFRALSALFIGGLLLAFPFEISKWLVLVIGVLFLIPGMVSIGAYFSMRSKENAMRPIFPIVGVGSLFFGLIMISFSDAFSPYLRYVLSMFLILATIGELVALFQLRRYTSIASFYYIVPFLLAVMSVSVVLYDKFTPMECNMVLGVASVVYAIQELLSAIRFRNVRRMMMRKEDTAAPSAEPPREQELLEAPGKENASDDIPKEEPLECQDREN